MDSDTKFFVIFLLIAAILLFIPIGYLVHTWRRVKAGKLTIREEVEIGAMKAWKALRALGYKLDYSIRSLGEIDRFIDDNVKAGKPVETGNLESDFGIKLFYLGSYVGETIRRKYGGKWKLAHAKVDPDSLPDATIELKDGAEIFPFHKTAKRIHNGDEDSLFFYGTALSDIMKSRPANEPVRQVSQILARKKGQDAIIDIDSLLAPVFHNNPNALSLPERNIVLIEELEREVNNGGFSQFFYNETGGLSEETLGALDSVGSIRFHAILKNALLKFPDSRPPKNTVERRDMLKKIEALDGEAWENSDKDFFKYDEDIYSLMIGFVSIHIAEFR